MTRVFRLIYGRLSRVLSWRPLPLVIMLLLAAYTLLRAAQGLNLSDDGFVLTAYAEVFAAPGSVAYMFLYYWTMVAGGAWNAVAGGLGIYGFRLLECVVLAANGVLAARLSTGAGGRWLYAALGLVVLYARLNWIEVFEYNTFTALVTLVVVALMMRALMRRSCAWMFTAGVALGLDVFVRLPNVCLGMLIVVLVPYYRRCRDGRLAVRLLLAAVGGAVAGVALTVGCMALAGHLGYFVEALGHAAFLSADPENSHGAGSLLLAVGRNWALYALGFGLAALCPALSLLVEGRVGGKALRRLLHGLLAAVWLALMFAFRNNHIYMINALALAACAYVAYERRACLRTVCLAWLAALVALLMPLGSDLGVLSTGVHNLWAAAPFVPWACALLLKRLSGGRRAAVAAYAVATLALIMAKGAAATMAPAYYERGTRLADVSAAGHPRANVLTDALTASAVDGALTVMRAHVSPGDTVLCAGDTPLLHYLTATRPYLRNPWPSVFGRAYFERQLGGALRGGGRLPVAVCRSADYYVTDGWRPAFRRFLEAGGYRRVYADDVFMIFVPQRNDTGGAAPSD